MDEEQRKQYLLEVGNRIKQLRLEREMSQDELARKSGYGARSTINKIELGINDVPQSKIKAIAEALGVTVGDLLCWKDFDNQHDTKAIQKEVNLFEQIEQVHGKTTREAFGMYVQLDTEDQGEIRGEMKQMLKDEKYSAKDGSSESKAM